MFRNVKSGIIYEIKRAARECDEYWLWELFHTVAFIHSNKERIISVEVLTPMQSYIMGFEPTAAINFRYKRDPELGHGKEGIRHQVFDSTRQATLAKKIYKLPSWSIYEIYCILFNLLY